MGCVPTIFAGPAALRRRAPRASTSPRSTNAACGGSAVPRQLMKDFEERHGVRIFQAWGMTETSPVATYSRPREGEHDDAYWDDRARQGRPLPWVELRLVDDDGSEVPWDGQSTGEIEVRGPWVAASYFREDADARQVRPRLAAHGRHRGGRREGVRADHRPLQGRDQVRRRVDLLGGARERADVPPRRGRGGRDRQARRALGRAPAVLRGAARGRGRRAPRSCSSTCAARVAKWWLPDEFAFVEEIPKTSVGKFDKKVLRGRLAEGELEGRVLVP